MNHSVDTLLEIAQAWMASDSDERTREEVKEIIERHDFAELLEYFGTELAFGTAGMRGAMGPGPNRMNRLMVKRVTGGLGRYLEAQVRDAQQRGVVVGFDGRHGSAAYASETIGVLKAQGFRVYCWDGVVPTPEVAHAVLFLNCAAGVMVTASHNPASDNGYKVYWNNGAQIIPPHDAGISSQISAGPLVEPVEDPATKVPEAVRENYLESVLKLRISPVLGARIVYTAMHGVGCERLVELFSLAGHSDLHVVSEQAEPNPDFPTVRFPNPEEDGALDLSIALATACDADLILANDPDADRLAVCVPTASGWRPLTGDQIGVLLAFELLCLESEGSAMVATSVVSSSMLSKMAAEYNVECATTLTGFKWIANKAISFEQKGGNFLLGYEEALGYCIGSVVRDKDGLSAALVFADFASRCKAEGTTVLGSLMHLYRRFGYHYTHQHSIVLPGRDGRETIDRALASLRQSVPMKLGEVKVAAAVDLLDITQAAEAGLEISNVIILKLVDGSRVIVRPSGTEPKLKLYFEVVRSIGDDATLEQLESQAETEVRRLKRVTLAALAL